MAYTKRSDYLLVRVKYYLSYVEMQSINIYAPGGKIGKPNILRVVESK
jgi:hypothetical protein